MSSPTTPTDAYGPRPGRMPGLAVATAVLGTVALLTSPVVAGGLLGVLGLALGPFALRAARRTGAGRATALIGAALSALAVAVAVVMAFVLVWFADRSRDCYQYHDVGPWTRCVQQQFDRG
ncbi:DUF4190 domain-containing protein [Kitasatospora sp. NPDC059795]|uniref:DUF4190 domain-containing protein n=1 Tax=Kitasatospora sp. NPDC059795 TaxID=3346949 RepID=UPI00365FA40C